MASLKNPQKRKNKSGSFWKTDRAILMICIGIAFIFWFFTKLSYSYKSTFTVKLDYQLPEDKILTIPPPKNLEIDVEGTGWDLMGMYFSRKKITLDVNLEDNNPKTLNSLNIKGKIGKQINNDLNILELRPDIIQLLPEEKASKEVAIILDNKIELAAQYQFKDSIELSRKTVVISGPASIIGEINSWKTVPIIKQNVEESFQSKIALKPHKNSNVSFDPQEIEVDVAVEQVTEKKFFVEIEKEAVPDSLLLVLLPKKIEVSCIVGLSDYDRINASKINAIADFSKINLFEESKVKINIKRVPSYVQQLQYQPKKASFIIRSQKILRDSTLQ